jgi:hypothetical protein
MTRERSATLTPPRAGPALRGLSPGELAELSGGLAAALRLAGAAPRIRASAHPASRVAALWMGGRPIMAVGQTIWWPGAATDFAGTPAMAVLQHELQHVLEFAQGRLSIAGYLLRPANWSYRLQLTPGLRWEQLGAEQRATAAERLWQAEQANDAAGIVLLRDLLPWAHT